MKKTNLATGRGGRVVATCFRCLFVIPMLLLGCFGATSAAAQTQQALSRVSLDAPDATVITVFQAIQQQTGCSFVYNTSDIDTDRKVSLSVHDEPLQAVLDKLFAGSDIAYTLRDKHIVLSKKAKNSPPHSAQGGVTGVIKDDKGMPLVGATVLIKGTTTGAAADIDGNFSLPQAKPGDTLEISLIGYTKQELPVSGSAPLSVVMHEDNEVLDAVVVTALGIKRSEKALTYNVQEVAGDIVNTVKDANFMNSLSGKVAGLQINASASGVGGSTRVVMRGVKSISGNNNALYVIDGIPMPDLRSSQTEGTYETPDGGDFEGISNLNPEDIESMTVLSGATAAALYGSQGANGVIVITTKRGRMAERAKINYRMQLGFSQIAYGNWDLMDTGERIQYEKEIGFTDGKNYNVLGKTNVNWLDEVFNDAALLQNYELSVSGATDKTNYYVSGGYYNQEGIAVGSAFERFSLRANVEQQAAKWLKLGTNTMMNYQTIERAESGQYTLVTPISAARFMMPYWNPHRPDGSLASIKDGTWKGEGQNPLEWLANNKISYKKYKVISTLFAEATPIEGLTIRSQFGVDYSHTTGFGASYPNYPPNLGSGTAQRYSTDGMSLSVTNTINYRFSLDGGHSFNFLLGQEGVDYSYEEFTLATRGQNNDKLVNISSGTRATSWSDVTDDNYAFLSFFARGEYNYADRYYVDFSVRTDGSSRFGTSGRWAAFGSVGMMWNLRNEKFMENSRRWLTNAQIAFSTGTSGNSSIPNYEHMALVSGGLNYYGDAGIAPSQPGNEDLQWEKLWITNLAVHLGFWNRLNVDVELYHKKNSAMLMEVPVSYTTSNGFGFRWDNVGDMTNRGVEVSLAADVIQHKDFVWSVNANVSYNRNKMTKLYSGVSEYELSSTNTKLVVGHSFGEFYLNRFAGVNPANGDALWYTKEGELTTELRDEDKVMVGKSYVAPWQGGFGTTLAWKGLSLSAQFSWVADRWMINNDRYFDESNGRFASYNQSKRLLNRWKKPGDITDIPRHGVYTEFDDRLLEDASFLRLKNLMLSYSFPQEWLRKTRFISGVKIYAQAQNLFTFTKFTGLDPEGSSNMYQAQYPMARQFTFGLDLTF